MQHPICFWEKLLCQWEGELYSEAYDLAVKFNLEKLGHLVHVCHAGAIAVRMAAAITMEDLKGLWLGVKTASCIAIHPGTRLEELLSHVRKRGETSMQLPPPHDGCSQSQLHPLSPECLTIW